MRPLSDAAVERLRRLADGRDERYEIGEPIGRGGMGTVYRAWDRELAREVAVKVLHRPQADAGAAARLAAEARILARLEHPGIVPVHDVGHLPDGRVFYAMRRVRGLRLDAHAATGVSLPERLKIFERVCEAVAFAHAHGVIHRDLKPENVMVGPFGEVLVMDWGVAKVRRSGPAPRRPEAAAVTLAWAEPGGDPAATAHGTVLGTPGYMAPEQAQGEVEGIDERADVYSLGALLHFLLAGRPPAPGGVSEPLRSLAPAVPRALEAIALRALAAEPAARYPSVEALAADVSKYLTGLAVGAYREGLLERLGRVAGRHRTAILLVLAYLAMRVALLVWGGR